MGRPRRWVPILFLLLLPLRKRTGKSWTGSQALTLPMPRFPGWRWREKEDASQASRLPPRDKQRPPPSRPPAQSGASCFPPAPRRRAPPRLVVPFLDLGTSVLSALAHKSCQVGGRFAGTPLEALALGLEGSCNIFIGGGPQERNDSPTEVPFSAASGLLLVLPEAGSSQTGKKRGNAPSVANSFLTAVQDSGCTSSHPNMLVLQLPCTLCIWVPLHS